jgi:four helix bundle protein
MSEKAEQTKRRTRRLALQVLDLIKLLPAVEPGPTVRYQLVKASTGMEFNYRAACRARTHTEFTAKMGVVAEEADETASWLDFHPGSAGW